MGNFTFLPCSYLLWPTVPKHVEVKIFLKCEALREKKEGEDERVYKELIDVH